MKMKKLLAMLIATTMCISVLAGCGSSSSSSSDTGSEEDSESSETDSGSDVETVVSDGYPEGDITITVAYSAGGSSDKLARMVQPYLQDVLGTNIVVENAEGASGQIAAEKVARNEADGYSILAVNVPGLFYTTALQDTTYTNDDWTALWVESYDPIIMLVLNDFECDTLGEFIEAAKANPGQYSIGYTSGSGQEATAKWLVENLDLECNLVAYDGGSDVASALLGGHIDIGIGDAYARVSLVSDAKALGIGSSEENSAWPDAVSFNEQLEEYGLQMPSDEFQARMGCYMVQTEFKEQYPERYETLVAAFEEAAANEEYIQTLIDANLYDSMVLAPGDDYADQIANSADEVMNVVVPLLEN